MAKKLLSRGVKPIKIDRATELTDPAIWITESIYIQVGVDYLVVFKSKASELAMYKCSLNINDIMQKLQQAINDD